MKLMIRRRDGSSGGPGRRRLLNIILRRGKQEGGTAGSEPIRATECGGAGTAMMVGGSEGEPMEVGGIPIESDCGGTSTEECAPDGDLSKATGRVARMGVLWTSFKYDPNEGKQVTAANFLDVPKKGVLERSYEHACNLIGSEQFTAAEVLEFSQRLYASEFKGLRKSPNELYFSQKLGVFLSAVINKGSDTDYQVDVRGFQVIHRPENLGYKNTKNITVLGDVMSGIGRSMERGSIRVTGSAYFKVGPNMTGGTITIEGDAEGIIGPGMGADAVIRVNGNIAGVTYPTGGKVYHRDELVKESISTAIDYSRSNI